jgi:hypothetical protein
MHIKDKEKLWLPTLQSLYFYAANGKTKDSGPNGSRHSKHVSYQYPKMHVLAFRAPAL